MSKKNFFIDKDEIEEMLSEYYDFSEVTETEWEQINSAIESECKKKGVSPFGNYEEYAKICDGCVSRVLKS